ncbi:MAG: hypothetical protein C0404_05360 [Verrucomicrobia bacterium]|nr:hypothetical protein [Verrucomicrobiota bacterium]
MTATALGKKQGEMLTRILRGLFEECDAEAVAVCEISGSILAQEVRDPSKSFGNAAALAAATFAAARALAESIGEQGFRSIYHKGRKSGIMIQSLGGEFIVLVVLSEKSVEGIVRLYLKKVTRQLAAVVSGADGQSLEDAGISDDFEVVEKTDAPDRGQ